MRPLKSQSSFSVNLSGHFCSFKIDLSSNKTQSAHKHGNILLCPLKQVEPSRRMATLIRPSVYRSLIVPKNAFNMRGRRGNKKGRKKAKMREHSGVSLLSRSSLLSNFGTRFELSASRVFCCCFCCTHNSFLHALFGFVILSYSFLALITTVPSVCWCVYTITLRAHVSQKRILDKKKARVTNDRMSTASAAQQCASGGVRCATWWKAFYHRKFVIMLIRSLIMWLLIYDNNVRHYSSDTSAFSDE